MSTSTENILQELQQEVIKSFTDEGTIRVTPHEGTPPTKYLVSYQLPSVFKNDRGDIEESSFHEVLITIPSGYPHFGPSCKPLTPIFHPDFDPSAIHLGVFWTQSQSLPELIIHIGKMITGEIYSSEEGYNKEAVDWYKNHSNQLPFTQSATNASHEKDHNPADSHKTGNEKGIDTLNDSDFEAEHNYLELEQDEEDVSDNKPDSAVDDTNPDFISLDESDFGEFTFGQQKTERPTERVSQEPVEKPVQDSAEESPLSLEVEEISTDEASSIDAYQVQFLIEHRRFHELLKLREVIESNDQIKDQKHIILQAENAVSKANELKEKATNLERKSLNDKALRCYQEAQNRVGDDQEINDAVERLELEAELKKDVETEKADDTPPEQETESSPPKKNKKAREQATGKRDIDISLLDEEGKKTRSPVALIIVVLIVVLISSLGGAYYFIDSQLKESHNLFNLCQESLQAKQFEQAKSQCNQALETSGKIIVIKQNEKNDLENQISSTLNSTAMQDGLAGKISASQGQLAEALTAQYNELFKLAQQKMTQSDWEGAINSYKEALELTESLGNVDDAKTAQIRKNLQLAQIHLFFNDGKSEIALSQWDKAVVSFDKGLEIIRQDPNLKFQEQTVLGNLANEARFHQFYELGKQQMEQNNWPNALVNLKQALSAIERTTNLQSEKALVVKDDIKKVQLYSEIESGRNAYTKGHPDKALQHYQKAVEFLDSHRKDLKGLNAEQYHNRLSRLMLNIKIQGYQKDVDQYLEKKSYDLAAKKLGIIINLIKNSPFSNDAELKSILKESQQSKHDADFQHEIATLKQYLKENYKSYFVQNYPKTFPENLSKPNIQFLKQIDNNLVFKIQCVQSKGATTLLLVLDYLYNPVTKTWALHSGESE